MASKQRSVEAQRYYNEYGKEATLQRFKIQPQTLLRYIRKAKEIPAKQPKILLFDLENSPMTANIWRLKQDYIHPNAIIKQSALLTWSAKWLCDSKIYTGYVTPTEADKRKDKRISKELWALIDEADIIIAHNVKGFDRKVMNTRFIINGLQPPSPYKMIDTLLESRKNFKFPSNKLDYLTEILVNNRKIHTSMELWDRCTCGNKEIAAKAIQEMLLYNKQDVVLLEELYLKFRPWIKSHPNVGLYYDDMEKRCPNCGDKDIKDNGKYYTTAGIYVAKRCNNCGAFGRNKYQELSSSQTKNFIRTIAI